MSLQEASACHCRGLSLSLRGSFPKQSVYYEIFRDVRNAISQEKQIKGGSRAKKIELINGMNAGWKDLYDGL
ncbi:GIY-YIG nuclease family protein [Candidatus Kuenenia stuttgartiensis]|uniref:GIY-YIG nuclease family protein n=1 Tax=Kuenenia stuttgartiensis TaxID=174633 RepID=UPI0013ED0553|nr:GIY-YIG nuclease family protein [Candidatus Kuenenia stuttgartiensis]MCF6153505.1 GIY-YIG nuclease family protein [Candidatus Kuenenia stuttgartiensis]